MAPDTHDFTATEIKAGILVLVSLVILVGFVATVRGCRPKDQSAKRFYATFNDISGLNEGADVRFGGVKVGRVVAIEPDPGDRSRIRVTAVVRGDVPVNHGSEASIQQVTLTTEKHLEISTGSTSQPLHASGDTLRSRVSGGGLIDMSELAGVISRLERLLDDVILMVGVDKARERAAEGGPEVVDLTRLMATLDQSLTESAGAVRRLGAVIEDNRDGFRDVVERLAALETSATELVAELREAVEENRQPLHETVANLQRLTGDTGARIEELAASLKVTLEHLQDTGGNASDLLDDQRPTIEEILLNLQEATRNLRELSRILADQPQALIRGRAPQGRTDGEKR